MSGLGRVVVLSLVGVLILSGILWLGRRSARTDSPDVGQSTASRFDPDWEKDSLTYAELTQRLGPVPRPGEAHLAAVMKFLGNHYWQLLALGMQQRAEELGVSLSVRAARTEADAEGQLSLMQEMLGGEYDAFLISPQTDRNLIPAVQEARRRKLLVLNVNDAVLEDAEHWVGPNQYENGVRAARFFLEKFPGGGKLAVIKGIEGVYAVTQRTAGFLDTLKGSSFQVVAAESGNWDLQESLVLARRILEEHPDLLGFYCNNDIMALGVVQAVKEVGRLSTVSVIGTDGIGPAYESIRAGELTATVDSFPQVTGRIAVEVAIRLLQGQAVPRAVFTPQNLITRQNVDDPLPESAAMPKGGKP